MHPTRRMQKWRRNPAKAKTMYAAVATRRAAAMGPVKKAALYLIQEFGDRAAKPIAIYGEKAADAISIAPSKMIEAFELYGKDTMGLIQKFPKAPFFVSYFGHNAIPALKKFGERANTVLQDFAGCPSTAKIMLEKGPVFFQKLEEFEKNVQKTTVGKDYKIKFVDWWVFPDGLSLNANFLVFAYPGNNPIYLLRFSGTTITGIQGIKYEEESIKKAKIAFGKHPAELLAEKFIQASHCMALELK